MPVIKPIAQHELLSSITYDFQPQNHLIRQLNPASHSSFFARPLPNTISDMSAVMAELIYDDMNPQPDFLINALLPDDIKLTKLKTTGLTYLEEDSLLLTSEQLAKFKATISTPGPLAIALEEGLLDPRAISEIKYLDPKDPIINALILLRRPGYLFESGDKESDWLYGMLKQLGAKAAPGASAEGFSPATEGYDDMMRVLMEEGFPQLMHSTGYLPEENIRAVFLNVNYRDPTEKFNAYTKYLRGYFEHYAGDVSHIEKGEAIVCGALMAALGDGQREMAYELLRVLPEKSIMRKKFTDFGLTPPLQASKVES